MSKHWQRIGWVGLSLVMIGALVFVGYFITQNEPASPTIVDEPTSDEITQALEELLAEEDDTQDPAEKNQVSATLDSVRKRGNEFAVAVREFNSVTNDFTIEVIATLSDPQPGNQYEVRIADGDITTTIGTLEKEVENTFALSYTTTENIAAFGPISVVEIGSDTQEVLTGTFE